MLLLLLFAGVVATYWWPVEARLFGYEFGLGGYDRPLASGAYRFGNGGAFILNLGERGYRLAWYPEHEATAPGW